MTDDQLLALLDLMRTAPSIVIGRHQFTYVAGLVVVATRVGKRDRFAFDTRDIHRELPDYYRGAARLWVERARAINFGAYAAAMGAHTL